MEITVANAGDKRADDVSYQVFVPADSIFNLNGDVWKPLYRQELDGAVYDVWQTLGGVVSTTVGGISILRAGEWGEKLAVNLKPYDSSIELLWQLLKSGDPIGRRTKVALALEPFAARF